MSFGVSGVVLLPENISATHIC